MVAPNINFEENLKSQGYRLIAGVDEVGRGALAGPIYACALILPKKELIPKGIRDSKKLTEKRREELAKTLKSVSLEYVFSYLEAWEIDQLGIQTANDLVIKEALLKLKTQTNLCLVDHFKIKHLPSKGQRSITRGEDMSISIAAASIVAKVERDAQMIKLANYFPEYAWEKNKGYGTKAHRTAIKNLGPTIHHRRTFKM